MIFSYATVGDEDNGVVLTILSVLARCGVDPWNEAARLNELPTGSGDETFDIDDFVTASRTMGEVGRGRISRRAWPLYGASEAVVGRTRAGKVPPILPGR